LTLQRLKTRPQFQAVLAGVTLSRTPHFALHQAAPLGQDATALDHPPLFSPAGLWIGAMVPKRWAKRAVTRNTIKRQVYSLSLDFAPRLAPMPHLVRLRCGFDRKTFVSATSDALKSAVRLELEQLFAKATHRSGA